MKKLSLYIILFILVGTLGSCTRNHGDIGPWFGTWLVEQITVDGTPQNVEGDYFFQFQSKVFRVSQVYGHENLVVSFGTWDESGGKMSIDFPDAGVFYIEMPGLEAHNDFTVTTTSSQDVTLTKADAAGSTITYRLHKNP